MDKIKCNKTGKQNPKLSLKSKEWPKASFLQILLSSFDKMFYSYSGQLYWWQVVSHGIRCSPEVSPTLGPGFSPPTKASEPLWVLIPSCAIHSWGWAHSKGHSQGQAGEPTGPSVGSDHAASESKTLQYQLLAQTQLQLLPEISNTPDQMEETNLLNFSWVCCRCVCPGGSSVGMTPYTHGGNQMFCYNSWRLPDEQQFRGVKNCYLAITSRCSHREVLLDITLYLLDTA